MFPQPKGVDTRQTWLLTHTEVTYNNMQVSNICSYTSNHLRYGTVTTCLRPALKVNNRLHVIVQLLIYLQYCIYMYTLLFDKLSLVNKMDCYLLYDKGIRDCLHCYRPLHRLRTW